VVSARLISPLAAATTLLLLASLAAGAHAAPVRQKAPASTTLIYGTDQEPDTLNRLLAQLVSASDILAGVVEPLVRSDAHDNIIPDLAASYNISRDNLTYTFHLRHGVRWADGAPFTAKDVLFTYRQITNPKNNNTGGPGANHISSVATPDDYTVVFHTSKVFAPFLTSMGETPILPAHYFQHSASFVASGNYNHDPYNRTPFGTGPYKVTQWVSADHITLVPNKYYWGRKPHFQKIVVKIVPNVNTLLVQLRTGEVQLARVSQQHVDVARSIPGTALVTRPSQAWYHIDLKQYGFLRDQQVRVALDYATPKRAILDKVLHGYGQVSTGDIAPTMWAYTAAAIAHPFNLKTAAALLASDGFTKGSDGYLQKGGRPLSMQLWYYNSDAPGAQIDDILAYEWGRIGVRVDLRHQDVSTIFGPNGPQFTKTMTGISYAYFNGNDPDDSY